MCSWKNCVFANLLSIFNSARQWTFLYAQKKSESRAESTQNETSISILSQTENLRWCSLLSAPAVCGFQSTPSKVTLNCVWPFSLDPSSSGSFFFLLFLLLVSCQGERDGAIIRNSYFLFFYQETTCNVAPALSVRRLSPDDFHFTQWKLIFTSLFLFASLSPFTPIHLWIFLISLFLWW